MVVRSSEDGVERLDLTKIVWRESLVSERSLVHTSSEQSRRVVATREHSPRIVSCSGGWSQCM
jgi:hypothetical protein